MSKWAGGGCVSLIQGLLPQVGPWGKSLHPFAGIAVSAWGFFYSFGVFQARPDFDTLLKTLFSADVAVSFSLSASALLQADTHEVNLSLVLFLSLSFTRFDWRLVTL